MWAAEESLHPALLQALLPDRFSTAERAPFQPPAPERTDARVPTRRLACRASLKSLRDERATCSHRRASLPCSFYPRTHSCDLGRGSLRSDSAYSLAIATKAAHQAEAKDQLKGIPHHTAPLHFVFLRGSPLTRWRTNRADAERPWCVGRSATSLRLWRRSVCARSRSERAGRMVPTRSPSVAWRVVSARGSVLAICARTR
jgi:hypothetical protein